MKKTILITMLIASLTGCRHESIPATIIDKTYQPSFSSTGSGISSSGKMVMTSSYEPEHWILIVNDGSKVEAIKVNSAYWASANKGDKVTLDRSAWGDQIQ